jgi:hypothetical protein
MAAKPIDVEVGLQMARNEVGNQMLQNKVGVIPNHMQI